MKSASVAIKHDTRKIRSDGRYRLRLRVTYEGKQVYYPLKYAKIPEFEKLRSDYKAFGKDIPEGLDFAPGQIIALSKAEYRKATATAPHEPYDTISIMLVKYREKAKAVINSIPQFSFDQFEKKYFAEETDQADVISKLKDRAKELRDEGRISSARAFDCAISSLKEYTGEPVLKFGKVTVKFLNDYEKWMLSEQKISEKVTLSANSPTTVGMYLACVRYVYRKAIKQGIAPAENYPFGKDDYQLPTGANVKKALTLADIVSIAKYEAEKGSQVHQYRDYWLFIYLCNGLNVKDMARLKYSSISYDSQGNGKISFIRAKTAREKKSKPRTIQAAITKGLGRIIDTWGNKPALQDQYIFPILTLGMTPQQEYAAVQQTTKMINRHIRFVAGKVDITQDVTTYVARHSFATILKRSGASREYISESLGHYSLDTTDNYLDSFEDEEQRAWAEKLLPENN